MRWDGLGRDEMGRDVMRWEGIGRDGKYTGYIAKAPSFMFFGENMKKAQFFKRGKIGFRSKDNGRRKIAL